MTTVRDEVPRIFILRCFAWRETSVQRSFGLRRHEEDRSQTATGLNWPSPRKD